MKKNPSEKWECYVRSVHRKKLFLFMIGVFLAMCCFAGRLCYLMLIDYSYEEKAIALHERERPIKAARGRILDCNGVVLADNVTVCTISVVHSQLEDPEAVTAMLTRELGLPEEYVRTRVEKNSSMERIQSNVSKDIGDRIRSYGYAGVKVDEDFRRYYPYNDLAAKVIGFTGSDNQGIIGLEVVYDEVLTGENGYVLAMTDAYGVELEELGERRQEPVPGDDLILTLDYNIQTYAMQLAMQAYETKQAESVSILVMNPQNGEIYAMVNYPEFNLNEPFAIDEYLEMHPDLSVTDSSTLSAEQKMEIRNQMWRNECINDTYEPGSIFKIITASAGFESGKLSLSDSFYCPGYVLAGDRRIRCARTTGHGQQDFTHAIMNSCNPAFVNIGLRIGVEDFYYYLQQFGIMNRTGIDLPGEGRTILHNIDNVGTVELATMAFGQSFQVTPIRLATTVSEIINGGHIITPHFARYQQNRNGEFTGAYLLEEAQDGTVVSEHTSEIMRQCLYQVVENGGGINGRIDGFYIGGKTATSQTLPRNNGVYIAAFLGFAPADNPKVLTLCIIRNPKGMYYGGQICAPVVRQLYENILPYLGIEKENTQQEMMGE